MEGKLPLGTWIDLAEKLSSRERSSEILRCEPDDRRTLAMNAYAMASFVAEAVHDGIDELMKDIDGAEAETHVPRMQIKTRFISRNDARVMELLNGHEGDLFRYFTITDREDGMREARQEYAALYLDLLSDDAIPSPSRRIDLALCDELADASVLSKEARELCGLESLRSSPSFLHLTEREFAPQDIADHAERMLIVME